MIMRHWAHSEKIEGTQITINPVQSICTTLWLIFRHWFCLFFYIWLFFQDVNPFMAKIALIWEILSWLCGAGSILRNLNALKLLSNQSNPLLLHFKWFSDPGVAYILIFCLFPILEPHFSYKNIECWAIFTWFWVPGANYITCMAYLCIVTFSKPSVQAF